MTNKKIKYIKYYVLLVIISFLLVPVFPTPSGIPDLSLSDILLLFSPFFLLYISKRIFIDKRVFILMFIILSITWSIFWGGLIGLGASIGDLMFLIKIAKYIGAVLLASALYQCLQNSDIQPIVWFLQSFVIIGVLLVGITVQQYFDLFSLNSHYVKFVAPTQYETLLGQRWPRSVGMIGNPNELGFQLALLSIASLWLSFTQYKYKTIFSLFGFIYLVSISFTMSRSSGFSLLLGLTILFILVVLSSKNKTKKQKAFSLRKNKLMLLIFIIGSTAGVQQIISKTNIVEQVLYRFSYEYVDKSSNTRIDHWSENIEFIGKSPLWGVGLLKRDSSIQYAADNEWIYLYRVGGFPLIILFLLLLFTGIFSFKKNRDKKIKILIYPVLASSFAYMIPAGLFFNMVLMPMVLMILTLSYPSPKLTMKI